MICLNIDLKKRFKEYKFLEYNLFFKYATFLLRQMVQVRKKIWPLRGMYV